MERVRFLKFRIDNMTFDEAVSQVDGFVDCRHPHQLVGVNAAKITRMQRDRKLADIVDSSSLIFADGQSIVWASRFLGCPLKERIAGIDLMHTIVRHASKKGYRIYFLGADKEIVEKLIDVYKKDFPQLNITGWHSGYFDPDDTEQDVVEAIKKSRPDILFVAMGTPRQEYWIRNNMQYLKVPVCMGVGGSFDVIAGAIKRAPHWMQRAGLEWFFRFINEPRRMWKRYLVGNSLFIWSVLTHKFGLDAGYSYESHVN